MLRCVPNKTSTDVLPQDGADHTREVSEGQTKLHIGHPLDQGYLSAIARDGAPVLPPTWLMDMVAAFNATA